VENSNIDRYKIREIKKFFKVASTDMNAYEYENLHYFSYISGEDGHEYDLPVFPEDKKEKKEKDKKNIINQSLEFIAIFKIIDNNKKFTLDELSFPELLTELLKLTPENLIKKPFDNENDLRKYMFNLKKANLLETNEMKRNASYKLTKKCRKYLKDKHYENLKFILNTKIKATPGQLIEYNFEKIMRLIEKDNYIIPEDLIDPRFVKVPENRVIKISDEELEKIQNKIEKQLKKHSV
jgi:predicted transcriptional regulator